MDIERQAHELLHLIDTASPSLDRLNCTYIYGDDPDEDMASPTAFITVINDSSHSILYDDALMLEDPSEYFKELIRYRTQAVIHPRESYTVTI